MASVIFSKSEYIGLKGETKPVLDEYSSGATFLEVSDSGDSKVYIWYLNKWYAM